MSSSQSNSDDLEKRFTASHGQKFLGNVMFQVAEYIEPISTDKFREDSAWVPREQDVSEWADRFDPSLREAFNAH